METESHLWVRCRDGAFYKNPFYNFDEGYILLSKTKSPEMVIWVGKKMEYPKPMNLLQKWLGMYQRVTISSKVRGQERQLIGHEKDMKCMAAVLDVEFISRPPVPHMHEGSQVWASRLRGQVIMDFEAESHDAYDLEMR